MGMRYRILAALSALVVAGGVAVVATSQQAGAQQEFSLVATQTNFAVIPAGSAATINPSDSYVPNTGDQVTFRDTLTQGTATVGFDTVICTDTFNIHGIMSTTWGATPVIVVSGPYARRAGMNCAVNALGQGNRANSTIGRAVQLTVRNVGGGRPGREDRAAHGQPGKLGFSFAERLDETAPWPGLAQARAGLRDDETGVTLFAGEAPRLVLDQLVRDPAALAASLAVGLEHVASQRQRVAWDAMLVLGPEHGRIFREAGWSRERVQQELHARTHCVASELVRGAGGVAEGLAPEWFADLQTQVPKFAGPERILLAYAGGDAGLFSMAIGGWVSGEAGSAPQSASVEPWR